MSSGSEKTAVRGDYPQMVWPDATEHVLYLNLSRKWDYLPALSGFAIGAYQRSASEDMDSELLKDSYQAAYRLLFVRRFAEVLSPDVNVRNSSSGVRVYKTDAVILVILHYCQPFPI